MKRFYFILFLIPAIGNLFLNTALSQTTGRFQVQLDTLGGSYALALYVPEEYDSTKSYPVTIGFHGSGMPADNMRDLLYVGESYLSSIIACPDYNNITSSNMFFARVSRSIEYLSSNFNIDSKKSILAGFSSGAYYAFNTALNSNGNFRGVIGICPALNIQSLAKSSWDNIKSTRMAVIIGNSDEFFPCVDSMANEINAKGGSLKYIVKNGMGHGDNYYFNSAEYVNDYTECYNYIFGQASDVMFDFANNSGILVGPNPANDRLVIDLSAQGNTSAPGKYNLKLYNLTGEKVYETNTKGERLLTINTSEFCPGIYILKAENLNSVNRIKHLPVIIKVVITR